MNKKVIINLIIIIILTVLAVLVDIPQGPNFWSKEVKIHMGLDLQGGTHLAYELDTSKIAGTDKEDAANSVVDVIDKRVNSLGVSEPVIQKANVGGKENIIVELPGVTNIEEAVNLIGKTAQLTFWEQSADTPILNPTDSNATLQSYGWKETELNGSHLKRSTVKFDQNTGNPYIALEFNDSGKDIFAAITTRNLGKPVAIVLDNQIISAPTVQSVIESGQAVITGDFTIVDAKNLVKLLNAGALPIPINLVEQRNIGATLGLESVEKSIFAGMLGLLLIFIFMSVIYKFPGFLSSLALVIYGLIVLALFKIIPVTLTLAGVAGFIISFGIAIDTNVLVFARMNEEQRKGIPTSAVIEQSFKRAWPSIFDSHMSTLITCTILYIFTQGLVRGFALTLGIGILISLFSAIYITRTFLRVFINTKLEKFLKI